MTMYRKTTRAVEAFIDALDLKALEFARMTPAEAGRPDYHPATMLNVSGGDIGQSDHVLANPIGGQETQLRTGTGEKRLALA